MIYKDQKGNEFNVSEEIFTNPNTGRSVTTNSKIDPILNEKGQQIQDPIKTLKYEYLGDQDISELGANYPYLYFGSEFANETVKPLPTTYSNAINSASGALHTGLAVNSINSINSLNKDKVDKTIYDNAIVDFAYILVDEFTSNSKTNMLTVYNNNLRMILDLYYIGPDKDTKSAINMNIDFYQFSNAASSLLLTEKGDPIIGLNSTPLMPTTISYLSSIISRIYGNIINKCMSTNSIDFYNLAKARIDKDGISVPAEYYYSFGVDIVREIANMEVGRNIDLIEINLAHMITRFNKFLMKNTDLLDNIKL